MFELIDNIPQSAVIKVLGVGGGGGNLDSDLDTSQQTIERSRFRNLGARDSSEEPFRSLEAMLNVCARGGAYVTIQRRAWRGIKNYGEVIGFRNRADGDRWDVFAPGLGAPLPVDEPFRLERVSDGGWFSRARALSPCLTRRARPARAAAWCA